MKHPKIKKIIAITYILLIFLSIIPTMPVSALVWGAGVTFNCDNEYYTTTVPITVDNLTIDTHWISVNGIGFNATSAVTVYVNFSSIQTDPHTTYGYIMNFTEQHAAGTAVQYIISGLKLNHDYIWVTNGTDYPQTSKSTGTLYLNQTGNLRSHKLYDPDIPTTTGIFVSVGWGAIPAGSDTTGDGSYGNPYKTLRKAVNVSTTGDTIYMRGGNYNQLGWSGTAGASGFRVNRSDITISGYNNEKVIIDGTLITLTGGYGLFMLYSTVGAVTTYYNNVTFHDLNISNSSWNGIVGGYGGGQATSDITITECDFYDITYRALNFWDTTAGTSINNLNINNCTFRKIQINGSTSECITFVGCKNVIFENNSLRDFTKQGIAISGGDANFKIRYNTFENIWYYSIKLDPQGNHNNTIDNIDIYNNLFFGYTRATATYANVEIFLNPEAGATGGTTRDINIYNNIFNVSASVGETHYGINIKNDLTTGLSLLNCVMKYNTFFSNGGASSYNIKATKGTSTITGGVIANNIFYTAGSSPVDQIYFFDLPNTQTSFTITNNQFYDDAGSGTAHGIDYSSGADDTGTNGLKTSPQFVSLTTPSFDINSTSPCKDSASAAYTTPLDFEGNTRPYDGSYDRGAYEYTITTPATPSWTFTGISPVNESTGVSFTPVMQVIIQETHGYKFNWSVYENTTGVWVKQSSGTNVNNGTYGHIYHNATATSTKYWWRVNASNGTTTWLNQSYCFTTIPPATPSFIFTGLSPINTTTGVSLTPTLHWTIQESHGYKFNFTISWNSTGAWVDHLVSYNTNNNTGSQIHTGAGSYSTKYWWKITAWNDSFASTTAIYHFTTLAAPVAGPPMINGIHANWTTTTSINITWTKNLDTTHSYLYRSTLGYMNGEANIYNGIGTYYNDTFKDPAVRYYYTLRPYNSTTSTWGTMMNISLAETEPMFTTTYCGASWLDFQGYIMTDKTIQLRYRYGDNADFTSLSTNDTLLQANSTTAGSSIYTEGQIYLNHQTGQTFITQSNRYYIKDVTIKARKVGTPNMLYCYLYSANTSTYLPSGAILSTGSINANTFTTAASGSWYNITMNTYYLLTNTRYCIVLSSSGSSANRVDWMITPTAPYTSGNCFRTTAPPAYSNITYDTPFKIWGNQPEYLLIGADTENTTESATTSFSVNQISLNPGHIYYYQARGNDTAGNMTRGNLRYTLTEPGVPTYLNMTPHFSNSSLYISWNTGLGANRTLIINGGSSYPVDETDGTILYNGTGSACWLTGISFNATYSLALFSYTVWADLHRFSSPATVPWGGISFNCYNESSGLPIGFSVLVSNKKGDHVYFGPDLNGFQFINITEIPLGEEIGFFVSNSTGNYTPRMYYFDLTASIFYNLSFYLAPALNPPITNDSFYYQITVVNEASQTIEGVYLDITTYIVTLDSFETVSSGYTDGNGQFSCYLLPNTFYKINASKDGYTTSITDYIPNNLVFTFTVKLYFETETPGTTYLWHEQHSFDGYLDNATHILQVNYTDYLGQTEDWQLFIWQINPNGTDTLVYTGVGTNDSFAMHYLVTAGYDYHVLIWVNHTTFGQVFDEWTTYGYHYHPTGKAAKFNLLMTINFGYNPFGWANTVGLFIMLGVLFSFGRRESYMSAILLGVLLIFLDLYIGFPTVWNALAAGFFPVLIIFIGVLMLIRDRGMFGSS